MFCVHIYPHHWCVMAEQRTGVGGGILGKMRPHLGKKRRIWAICTKSGQKCSRFWGGGIQSSNSSASVASLNHAKICSVLEIFATIDF